MIGKRTKKKLDPKGTFWFGFYSVNGTCQHHRKMSWKQARDFAREQGYIGRFKITEAPVKPKKKVAAKKRKPAKKKAAK